MFVDRYLDKAHTRTYFFSTICILVFYIFVQVSTKLVAKLISCVVEKMKVGGDGESNEAHSDDFYKEIKIKHLADISNKANKQLDAFKGFTIRDFSSYRYEEELTIESRYYKELLTQRVD